MARVIISDCDRGYIEPETEIFAQAGISVDLVNANSADDVLNAAGDSGCIISQYAPITNAVIQACPNLKIAARYGVGVDTIDVEAASRAGVAVCNVTNYCDGEVADQALGLI